MLRLDWLLRQPVHNGEGSSVWFLASAGTNNCPCYDPNRPSIKELPNLRRSSPPHAGQAHASGKAKGCGELVSVSEKLPAA